MNAGVVLNVIVKEKLAVTSWLFRETGDGADRATRWFVTNRDERLGLSDLYSANDRDNVMYWQLSPGVRRLPDMESAAQDELATVAVTPMMLPPSVGAVESHDQKAATALDASVEAVVGPHGTSLPVRVPLTRSNRSHEEISAVMDSLFADEFELETLLLPTGCLGHGQHRLFTSGRVLHACDV